MGGEGLPHVLVPLIFLVDQVVSGSDVVVAISFKASDRVILFKLEISDQALQQILLEWHLLQAREKSWFSWL